MVHIRETVRVMGAENMEIILKDVDGGKITLSQMDSFAGHEAMADIVGGRHRRRTRGGRGFRTGPRCRRSYPTGTRAKTLRAERFTGDPSRPS